MTVIFESADARSLAITAILTLFIIHAFLDPLTVVCNLQLPNVTSLARFALTEPTRSAKVH